MTYTPGPSERQQAESARAFEAFRIYLDLGPGRTTAEVGRRLGHRGARQAQTWSAKHGWVDRIRQIESADAVAADVGRRDQLRRIAERQAQEARAHANATLVVARAVLDRYSRDPAWLDDVDAVELLRAGAAAARAHARVIPVERLALGMTTDQPGEPLPRTTVEEIAARMSEDELVAKLAGVDELAARRAEDRDTRARTVSTAEAARGAADASAAPGERVRPNPRPDAGRAADARRHRSPIDDLRDRINQPRPGGLTANAHHPTPDPCARSRPGDRADRGDLPRREARRHRRRRGLTRMTDDKQKKIAQLEAELRDLRRGEARLHVRRAAGALEGGGRRRLAPRAAFVRRAQRPGRVNRGHRRHDASRVDERRGRARGHQPDEPRVRVRSSSRRHIEE